MNPKIDEYISNITSWQKETEKLREILLNCGLEEELKWGKPCYTFQESNIVIIQGFKAYCALLFFKGALLKDPDGIMVKTGEHTQSGRQVRFTDVRQIARVENVLKAYVHEAVEAEKAGLKVPLKKTEAYVIPEEFQHKLDENPELKTAFDSLTPGRQRAYLLYFSGAKQSGTRTARVAKCIPLIISGKGLNDR